jgi:PAS domain S-box-containing protein
MAVAVTGAGTGDEGGSPSASRQPHVIQFYDDQATLARAVVDFLAPGLAARQSALVISTPAHRAAFQARLSVKGFDVPRGQASGQLLFLDVEDTLRGLLVDGWPDWRRFSTLMFPLLERAAAVAENGQVRVYGEMVDVLWRRGSHPAALRLEEMWSEIQEALNFSVLCGYAFSHFHGEIGALDMVCGPHTHVLPPAGVPYEAPAAEHLRSLAAEIAHRKEVERALRASVHQLREKEQTLRQTEDELRDFVENGSVALHWVGPDGIIRWANRAELEFLGYREDEYVGKPFADLHEDADCAHRLLEAFRAHEDLHGFEARLRAKDGSTRYVLINASPYWREGEFVHTRCITRDITEWKAAERAREAQVERAERLKTITAAVADAVTADQVFEAVVDQVGAALGASNAALWLLRPEAGIAQLCRSVGYEPQVQRALLALPLDGGGPSFPVLTALRTGELVWLESQADLLARYPDAAALVTPGRQYSVAVLPVAAQGRTLGALAFTFDDARPLDDEVRNFLLLVSRYAGQALERLRLFEAEQQSRQRAELLYGLAAAVIGARRVEDVFDAALDSVERALGTDRAAIQLFEPDGVLRFRAWRNLSDEFRRQAEDHPPWPRDVQSPQTIVSADVETDGEMIAALLGLREEGVGALAHVPLLSAGTRGSGNLVGGITVYYPGRRALASHERELLQAIANHVAAAVARFASIADLQKTVHFNEVFTGILGHDLRNPLSAILTSARLALKRDEGERLRRPLERIVNSGHRMTRMIDQLLDFTRFRLGVGLSLVRARIDLGEIVRQVVEELEDAQPEGGLRLRCLGAGTGSWDADRLAQVFSNLIGNAIQHGTPDGAVHIVVDGRTTADVVVRVQNQGVIPAEFLPTVFEPMAGGESLIKGRGLGLGLYISRELVHAHGGQIEVTSDRERGTVFSVRLPRTRVTAQPPGRDTPRPTALFTEDDSTN